MGTAAYYLALACVMAVPAAMVSLFFLNLLSPDWRRGNPVAVRVLRVVLILAVMGAVFTTRQATLRLHFGVKVPLVVGAVALFAVSSYLRIRMLKEIPAKAAFELTGASSDGAGELATCGIYSRIRHPGHVAMVLAVAAAALFTNYAAVYAVAIAFVPLIYLAARLEERELEARFPGEYSAYCERVPRFFPRGTTSGLKREGRQSD
jgi:protein-S-isoprenylcysteine O-methyltransferase Ste14